MSTLAVLPGIVIDDDGTARIEGTRMMVSLIACEKNGGWSPEEIQAQHPHLTLAQVYAALTYYYDNKEEMDARIEQEDREYLRLWKAQNADPAFLQHVKALKERYQALKEQQA